MFNNGIPSGKSEYEPLTNPGTPMKLAAGASSRQPAGTETIRPSNNRRTSTTSRRSRAAQADGQPTAVANGSATGGGQEGGTGGAAAGEDELNPNLRELCQRIRAMLNDRQATLRRFFEWLGTVCICPYYLFIYL
jgi:hypothetical protein